METPSSNRRVTRSQTLASLSNSATTNTTLSRKMEDSEKELSKTKQRTSKQSDRSALIDITNDSPIVGLASGNLETPISSRIKQRSSRCKKTPGSGEALLRGQVKNLLQKVEEEAEISKFSLPSNGFKGLLNSPAGLLAPTPANTPQVLNFSSLQDEFGSFDFVSQTPVEDKLNVSQVVIGISDGKKPVESSSESDEKDLISRTLFLEFSEKSETSSECSSVVTYQGVETGSQEKPAPLDDDDASIWSIQVNASTRGDDEDEDEVIDDGDGDVYDDDDDDDDDDDEDYGEEEECDLLDELCEGMNKISVNEEKKEVTFKGKHKRFVYNSDDELVEEHEECPVEADSAELVRLKGLPTPKGKHLRFQDVQADDQL